MTRKRDVSASYDCEAAERPETVASHRRRPLEAAIFIVDGTDKYQGPVDRSCTHESFDGIVQIML